MEVDELPQFDPNVDYNEIFPIAQKRTLAFINHFVTNTVSFLNTFAQSCESRLIQFEYKLQKVEASLLILEAQLASIPDIDVNQNSSTVDSKEVVVQVEDIVDLPEIVKEDVVEESIEEEKVVVGGSDAPIACKDPRFAKFFKMVQFGVPPQAVKLKMAAEGIEADILDTPNSIIPGYIPAASNDVSSSESD